VSVLLTIGDFSRMTHLSVKALRHYHDVGLLEPTEVDRSSGYRFYDASLVPVAQVIRRFRDLGMPVDEVKAVLAAPDVDTRNKVIVAHLERMEAELEQTKATVASLRNVLEAPVARPVTFRSVPAQPALLIREHVTHADMEAWWIGCFQELRQALADAGPAAERVGPDACLYPSEMFEDEEGEMVAYVPVTGQPDCSGRVQLGEIPAVELAIMNHEGPYDDLDRTYGAVGTFVAERAIGVEGPIREHYLVGPLDDENAEAWRTEVGWPVFRTVPGS
jgi:DNA-binding transcriptional MerR regulator